MRIERFTYEAPFNHEVHFELLEYRKGKLQESQGKISFSSGRGNQSFSVYVKHDEENIKVSIESNRGGSGFAAVSLKGLNAIAWSSFEDAKVDPSTKAPIVGFAANSDSITGSWTSESLDVIASKYDLFVVVTAQIEKE